MDNNCRKITFEDGIGVEIWCYTNPTKEQVLSDGFIIHKDDEAEGKENELFDGSKTFILYDASEAKDVNKIAVGFFQKPVKGSGGVCQIATELVSDRFRSFLAKNEADLEDGQLWLNNIQQLMMMTAHFAFQIENVLGEMDFMDVKEE